MPKCSCAGSACNCLIKSGTGITVSGTGNSAAPYIISTSGTIFSQDVTADGPVDLSPAGTGSVVRVNLSVDAPEVTFPIDANLFEIVVHHTVAATHLTWPDGILWPDGTEPDQANLADRMDWFLFRRVGENWIGTLLAGNVH